MSAPAEERPVVRRRPRTGDNKLVSLKANAETYDRALAACHDRGVSLASQLDRALERIAAGEQL